MSFVALSIVAYHVLYDILQIYEVVADKNKKRSASCFGLEVSRFSRFLFLIFVLLHFNFISPISPHMEFSGFYSALVQCISCLHLKQDILSFIEARYICLCVLYVIPT